MKLFVKKVYLVCGSMFILQIVAFAFLISSCFSQSDIKSIQEKNHCYLVFGFSKVTKNSNYEEVIRTGIPEGVEIEMPVILTNSFILIFKNYYLKSNKYLNISIEENIQESA